MEFTDGAEVIDEGLLLMFADGRSYTVSSQLSCRCTAASCAQAMLSACPARGARQAEPGEFTCVPGLTATRLAQAGVLELINSEVRPVAVTPGGPER